MLLKVVVAMLAVASCYAHHGVDHGNETEPEPAASTGACAADMEWSMRDGCLICPCENGQYDCENKNRVLLCPKGVKSDVELKGCNDCPKDLTKKQAKKAIASQIRNLEKYRGKVEGNDNKTKITQKIAKLKKREQNLQNQIDRAAKRKRIANRKARKANKKARKEARKEKKKEEVEQEVEQKEQAK